MAIVEYTVILHRDPEHNGYWAEVPALPGCVSQGKTKDQALKNAREAIELHVETMRQDEEEIPQEESAKITLQV